MNKTSEPLIFGIEKEKIESFLVERGFQNIKDVGSEYLKERYFKDQHRNRKIKPWWRIVHATTTS